MIKFYFSLLVCSAVGILNVNAQWTNNYYNNTDVCITNGLQSSPEILEDGKGGAFITWRDYRNLNTADVFVQRVDSNGFSQWVLDGLNICTNPQVQNAARMCSDGNDGLILSWSDARNGNSNRDIYAQKVNASGIIQWTYNGIAVANSTSNQFGDQIVSDGAGGAIIAWQQGAPGLTDIYVNRIDANGNKLWGANGVEVTTAFGNKEAVKLLMVNDGLIAVWQDERNGDFDIYAQKFDLSGTRQWGNGAKSICNATNDQTNVRITKNPTNNSFFAFWVDRRNGGANLDIYGNRVDVDGNPMWTASGATICNAAGVQTQLEAVALNNTNKSVLVWRDYRSGGTSDIYAQVIDTTLNLSFTANGIAVNADAGDQLEPDVTVDTKDNIIVAWQDKNGGNSNIRAQKLNPTNSSFVWSTPFESVSFGPFEQVIPKICADAKDGLIAVWEDQRDTSNINIKAQRLRDAGVYIPLNIINYNNLQVQAYPNPCTNSINIITKSNEMANISIIDLNGRQILNLSEMPTINNNIKVSLPNEMGKGLYILQVHQSNNNAIIKLVKE
jgi:hypothetical protein